MTSFWIEARFPTGNFLAHGPRGQAEWPPSPARLASAILNTAYRTGHGIDMARKFFTLSPPVIQTPHTGLRNTNVQRWVPVDPPITNYRTGQLGRRGKLQKPPERGMTIGDGAVQYRFSDTGLSENEVSILSELVHSVPYLGRPTSPVMLTLTRGTQKNQDSTLETWTPDPRGNHELNVADEEFLTALDRREVERRSAGVTGYHPRLRRSTATYQCSLQGADTKTKPRPSRKLVEQQLLGMVSCRLPPKTVPQDLPAVIGALGLSTEQMVLPIFGEHAYQGLKVPRLYSLLISGTPKKRSEQHAVILDGRPVELRLSLPRSTLAERETVASAISSSFAWTTLVPVRLDPRQLLDEVEEQLADKGARLIEATAHSAPRPTLAPAMDHHPDLTHVSLLFDRSGPGPLSIGGGILTPFDPKVHEEPTKT